MRVPDEVHDCVVFIGVPTGETEDGLQFHYGGTAFFVAVPFAPGQSFVYLVTAKHVADRVVDRQFVIRINRPDAAAGIVVANRGHARWWTHPTDPSADVAVMLLAPDPAVFSYKTIPVQMFATDEILKSASIGTGDEVFITGLFTHVTGSTKNIPIVRTGNVAMMPGDRVPTALGDIEAYLIEARSIGGVSGSPVFVRETVVLPLTLAGGDQSILTGAGRFFLLGLMHGHWDMPPRAKNDMADDVGGAVNMGIAIVVPAKTILEVINQPDLEELRRAKVREEQSKLPLRVKEDPGEAHGEIRDGKQGKPEGD